jgi:hypothetical protein
LRDPVEEETESAVAEDDSPELSTKGGAQQATKEAAAKSGEDSGK